MDAHAPGRSYINNLKPSDIEGLSFLVPDSRKERTAIARRLDAWDDRLGKTQKLIEALDQRRRALMQQLLTGKRRFPEFTEPWKTYRIGQLLKQVNRYVDWDDGKTYRLLSIRRRSGGLFHRKDKVGRDIKTKVMKVTRGGDFVIAKMQVIHGALAMTPQGFDGMHVSDSYLTFVPRDPNLLHMPYFNYLSCMPEMYYKAWRSSYGVAIEKMTFNLSWYMHEEVTIPPTIDEQRRIAAVLEAADREIALLRRKVELLRKQKRGLMQRLLTGKIRVKGV